MAREVTPFNFKHANPNAGALLFLAAGRSRERIGTYLQQAFDSRSKMQRENAEAQSKSNTGRLLDSMFRGEVIDPVGLYDATALAKGRYDYNNQQYDRGQDTLANSRADERLGLSRAAGGRAERGLTDRIKRLNSGGGGSMLEAPPMFEDDGEYNNPVDTSITVDRNERDQENVEQSALDRVLRNESLQYMQDTPTVVNRDTRPFFTSSIEQQPLKSAGTYNTPLDRVVQNENEEDEIRAYAQKMFAHDQEMTQQNTPIQKPYRATASVAPVGPLDIVPTERKEQEDEIDRYVQAITGSGTKPATDTVFNFKQEPAKDVTQPQTTMQEGRRKTIENYNTRVEREKEKLKIDLQKKDDRAEAWYRANYNENPKAADAYKKSYMAKRKNFITTREKLMNPRKNEQFAMDIDKKIRETEALRDAGYDRTGKPLKTTEAKADVIDVEKPQDIKDKKSISDFAGSFLSVAENYNPEYVGSYDNRAESIKTNLGFGDDKYNTMNSALSQMMNHLRHSLFGSALTKNELEAWNKAAPTAYDNETAFVPKWNTFINQTVDRGDSIIKRFRMAGKEKEADQVEFDMKTIVNSKLNEKDYEANADPSLFSPAGRKKMYKDITEDPSGTAMGIFEAATPFANAEDGNEAAREYGFIEAPTTNETGGLIGDIGMFAGAGAGRELTKKGSQYISKQATKEISSAIEAVSGKVVGSSNNIVVKDVLAAAKRIADPTSNSIIHRALKELPWVGKSLGVLTEKLGKSKTLKYYNEAIEKAVGNELEHVIVHTGGKDIFQIDNVLKGVRTQIEGTVSRSSGAAGSALWQGGLIAGENVDNVIRRDNQPFNNELPEGAFDNDDGTYTLPDGRVIRRRNK